ncbi:metallophosphoesterase [Zhengella mangrovi]|uniref:Metallophosphoesterase n=1 Tax=Zhengella mangrovi TaxID=1982044 RepID=A0A2G1QMV3_9HYPH|nr:metallophosphoesterase [Zhengella mangrovi]PHP66832.1 metallophosphoesterase [Zhengella mangrovi]
MGPIDIIPDIHGQHAKLMTALDALGWRRTPAGWIHPDPDRSIVFLGDFIDRGPNNEAVIRTVRDLIDAGKARAVMGNHELNAIHYHTVNPVDGEPLRLHSQKNEKQHGSFLAEFPFDSAKAKEAIGWMRGLPLFLEDDGFRAVHASWMTPTIDRLRDLTTTGVLSEEQFIEAATTDNELFHLVEATTKGPEGRLPDGHSFEDKDGQLRHHVRLQWWKADAATWRDIAMSVPDPAVLPDEPLTGTLLEQTYAAGDRPVFFGHYWLTGDPVLQAHNALCLDYSAGKDGPLVTYEWLPGDGALTTDRIRVHAANR